MRKPYIDLSDGYAEIQFKEVAEIFVEDGSDLLYAEWIKYGRNKWFTPNIPQIIEGVIE